MSESDGPIADLVQEKRVIVCCGAGGVGKTTTAAALGLAGARMGRKVLVLTIDPARRLAEAMGIPEAAVAPAPVSSERMAEAGGGSPGELHAWMLNPKVVFESMVRRLSSSPEGAEQILSNRIYRHLSEMVAGMQEYTAAEALFDLASRGVYDLIVLDTPPSRNALEFLEAPGRLARFLDERILGLFLPDRGRKGRFWGRASALIGNVFSRVFGQAFYEELQQFLDAFSGMFSAMRLNAEGVKSLLAGDGAAFLIVTSPEQAALSEAVFMRDKILDLGLPFRGYVLNRSWACCEGFTPPEEIALPEEAPAPLRSALHKMVELARGERERMSRDRGLLAWLRDHAPRGAVAVAAPHLGGAVEDLRGLAVLASGLICAPAAATERAS